MLSQPDALQSLGSSSTDYQYDGADAALLEYFPNPLISGPGRGTVKITAPEFTSLCPKTGQPDFATIVVEYQPFKRCVESKSFKLYLGSYRGVGEFHESCVRKIANDLIRLLDPITMTVRGEFTPRGGIPFWPEVTYQRPQGTVRVDERPTITESYMPEGGVMQQPQELAIVLGPEGEAEFIGCGLAFPDENGRPIWVQLALLD
jgi:7-cyano-7-deazaguanine reductase